MSPEEEEAFSALIGREMSHVPGCDYSKKYKSSILDPTSRQNAVSWLFKVRDFYGFNGLTAALAVNYLDRFLSCHQLPKGKAWMIQLLSVTCLSLAVKMEEIEVPLLLDFQVGPDFFFEPRTIQRMELLVLSRLQWRVSSVTPFSYLDYLIPKLGLIDSPHQHILCSRTSELLLCAVKELRFLDYRPSSIAVAAMLCAMQSTLPLRCSESKKTLMSMLPSELQEPSERCYEMMLEHFVMPVRLPRKGGNRANSVPQSPIGVLEASFSISDSESTLKLPGSDPCFQVSSPTLKKRRVDD